MSLQGLLARLGKWLTRAHRHEFEVVKSFAARSAISNEERVFNPGDRLVCEKPEGPTVMIENGGAFFLVDRSVFEASTKQWNPGA